MSSLAGATGSTPHSVALPLPNDHCELDEVPSCAQPAALSVFFDGACPLCSAEIALYRKSASSGPLQFLDVSGEEFITTEPGTDNIALRKRSHVRVADGTIHSGARAFGHLWLALPAWRRFGRIILLPGIVQVSEIAYRCFLILRPTLQGLAHLLARAQAHAGK